jgi:hypothetical protein
MFWTGQELGFGVLAYVADTDRVYPLLGRPHDALGAEQYNVSFPTYTGANYDASTTNLTYSIAVPPMNNKTAQTLEIVLSFLSPITPTSTLRQALPASYLSVHVKGTSNVDIYVDVNGQWVSGDRGSHVRWELKEKAVVDENGEKGTKIWSIKRSNELMLTEQWDRAEWGTLHFMAPQDVRHESGTSAHLRQRFAKGGRLGNRNDDKHRTIQDDEPVLAFSKSFVLNGTGGVKSDSVLFTIAHTQDPVIQFAAARGMTMMRPLWASWFKDTEEMLAFHYHDFENASKLAGNYSAQLAKDAFESGAEDYVDIVALSARQAMGATSFAGTPDNPILFLKEISSDGNMQTIDVIYPAFPFFLYTNPRWLAYLLEPLIEHMLSGQYPNTYAMHDLGSSYPNATGHPDGRDEYMPVEECGNILIMGLALVNSLKYDTGTSAGSVWATSGFSGAETMDENPDSSAFALTSLGEEAGIKFIDDNWGGSTKGAKQAYKWVDRSYKLWKQWTGYLVEFSLEPANQLSTDDFAGWLALQTNLALKGIIGIRAMSEIAATVGKDQEAKEYLKISEKYIAKWEEYGMSRDGTHAQLAYDWYGSWTTIYNLYADALLCFHMPSSLNPFASSSSPKLSGRRKGGPQLPLVPMPDEKRDSKDAKGKEGFVPSHIYKLQSDWYHNVRQKYGLPLDSRHLYTKTDWEFFATSVASKKVRAEILDSVARWVNETVTGTYSLLSTHSKNESWLSYGWKQ